MIRVLKYRLLVLPVLLMGMQTAVPDQARTFDYFNAERIIVRNGVQALRIEV